MAGKLVLDQAHRAAVKSAALVVCCETEGEEGAAMEPGVMLTASARRCGGLPLVALRTFGGCDPKCGTPASRANRTLIYSSSNGTESFRDKSS